MGRSKNFLICVAFVFISLSGFAQSATLFNGQFNITYVESTGGEFYTLKGSFSDLSNVFNANQVQAKDRIIDANGTMFELISYSVDGSNITIASKSFTTTPPTLGLGILYRPTASGFPMITNTTPAGILTSAVNTTTISIDSKLPAYQSGSPMPVSAYTEGDVVWSTSDSKMFKFANGQWNECTSVPEVFDDLSTLGGTKGDVVRSFWDGQYYVYNGSSWLPPVSITTLPSTFSYGDVFYETLEKKLYMFGADGNWICISTSTMPGGTTDDQPTSAKPGDFYFNTEKNILYVYDIYSRWVEVSIDGSVPKGIINPDPATNHVKAGNLFYNTSDSRLYFYNGIAWIPVDNSLASGQIYVGNASNIATPVTMSGDATVNISGKLLIQKHAITDDKLDKSNIPISGFDVPNDNVSMGDGTTNYRITNMANPTAGQDAVTKNYVDILFSNPTTSLALPSGNLFVGNISGRATGTAKSSVPLSGFGPATANVSLGDGTTNYKIINLANPTLNQDAATKTYVDTKVFNPANISLTTGYLLVGNAINTASAVAKSSIPLSGFGAASADVSLGGFKLGNVSDPLANQDAATKNYVDNKIIDPANITLSSGNMLIGSALGKASSVTRNTIPLSGFAAPTTDILMGDGTTNFKISNLADPVTDRDAVTKKYLDAQLSNPSLSLTLATGNVFVGNTSGKAAGVSKKTIPLSDFGTAAADISMGNAAIQNHINFLADPMYAQDAATKNYVDNKIANPGSLMLAQDYILLGNSAGNAEPIALENVPISALGVAKSDIVLGDFKITALADPSADQDAATKKYVDSKTGTNPSGSVPPLNPTTGSTYYNTTDKILYVYNGSQWVPVSNDSNDLTKDQFFVGNASNKAASTDKVNIPLSGFGAPVTDVSMGGKRLLDVATPILSTDAANKTYVDVLVSTVGGGYMSKTVYDTDGNNKADDADKVNGLTVATAVPANAVFTDEKVKVGATGTAKVLSETDFDDTGTAISIKSLSVSKLEPVAANSLIGNNTSADAVPKSLGAAEVKTMLALNNVDNTKDINKNVYSATRLTNPVTINGVPFDGSADVSVPGDDLGNHTASQNIKTAAYSISSDGLNGRGLSFESAGNAVFGQNVTVKGNLYTPSDRRLKTRVETLGNVLKTIDQLRGVRFEYIDQTKYASGPKIGVIAQELREIYPEMVATGSDGFLKVDYTQLTAVLIQAVKEQQEKLQDQQLEIKQLKARLDRQQQQINVILQKIEK